MSFIRENGDGLINYARYFPPFYFLFWFISVCSTNDFFYIQTLYEYLLTLNGKGTADGGR